MLQVFCRAAAGRGGTKTMPGPQGGCRRAGMVGEGEGQTPRPFSTTLGPPIGLSLPSLTGNLRAKEARCSSSVKWAHWDEAQSMGGRAEKEPREGAVVEQGRLAIFFCKFVGEELEGASHCFPFMLRWSVFPHKNLFIKRLFVLFLRLFFSIWVCCFLK